LRRDYFREWYAATKSKEEKAEIVKYWNHWLDFYTRCHDARRTHVAGKTFPEKYLPPEENELRRLWGETKQRKTWDPEALSA
jgi:hypothetical protein